MEEIDKTLNKAQQDRLVWLEHQLSLIDGGTFKERLAKHMKMSTSPFLFFRGSAALFYADFAQNIWQLPQALLKIPLTTIVGDCHTSNFGFITEEGSHGDTVIFAVNDFDDACMGHAGWDLMRLITSLFLCVTHCQMTQGSEDGKKYRDKPCINLEDAKAASQAFIETYIKQCQISVETPHIRFDVMDEFSDQHILYKPFNKALKRAAGGEDFTLKSTLAKAIDLTKLPLRFNQNSDKFIAVSPTLFNDIHEQFSPYVDDTILDIVERINAGTGSINMSRYYLLVGPTDACVEQLSLCHLVEVKQQRPAAPLFTFDSLSPVNLLNPAHLTANCQRRMQRHPDLVLDEVAWQGHHWLVRSRHHAKVGIDPEYIGLGKKATTKQGFIQYASSCGKALALAHCRGDRRSTLFEQQMIQALGTSSDKLIESATHYAQQVEKDTQILNLVLNPR